MRVTKEFAEIILKSFNEVPDVEDFGLHYFISKNREEFGREVNRVNSLIAPSKNFLKVFNPKSDKMLERRFKQITNSRFINSNLLDINPCYIQKNDYNFKIGAMLGINFLSKDENIPDFDIELQRGSFLNYIKLINAFWQKEAEKGFLNRMLKNIFILADRAKDIYESNIYKEFIDKVEKPRMMLTLEHSTKDENGNPKVNSNGGIDIENPEEFNNKIEQINKNNEDVLDEYEKYLKETQTVKAYKFDVEDVPDVGKEATKLISPFII